MKPFQNVWIHVSDFRGNQFNRQSKFDAMQHWCLWRLGYTTIIEMQELQRIISEIQYSIPCF